MSSVWGSLLKVTTFGESHGSAVGCVVDGLPSDIEISIEDIQSALNKRKPGQSSVTTPRIEDDIVEILSGLENGRTLGSPIAAIVRSLNQRPEDYKALSQVFRPSHADYAWHVKYGNTASSGGGRSSARETVARVIAGSISMQYLKRTYPNLKVAAWVSEVGGLSMASPERAPSSSDIESSPIRCPDKELSRQMIALIENMKGLGDSVGGVVSCMIDGVPAGLGEPIFDKFDAELAKAMMSLPASKGFEIGSGFASARMKGSEANDEWVLKDNKPSTTTNHSGGIQGGVSNGQPVFFRVAFKPPSTINMTQQTLSKDLQPAEIKNINGRHDPCVVARAVPIVEAMAAIVLCDLSLRQMRMN